MKKRFFDFEVFPHWWCCVFGNMPDNMNDFNENAKSEFIVVSSDDKDCRDKLLSLLKENDIVVMGYNIKHYDLIIANAIYQGFSPEQVKIVNDLIIRPDLQWSSKEHIRLQPFAKKRLSNIVFEDLIDDCDGTLKQKEAIMGLSILESDVDFETENLTDEDKEEVIHYCKHDVYASMEFFRKYVDIYCNTKLAVGRRFNIDEATCYRSTNAQLVAKALGAVRISLPDFDRVDIKLPEKIRQYCENNLPDKVLNYVLNNTDGLEVQLFGNKVTFGNGGLHSVLQDSLYVEADDEFEMLNVDVSSYYPSIMIEYNLLSRAVQNKQVFKDIFEERLAIKHKANKTWLDEEIQMADKLILNTTFGASGNKYLDLYDPYMCTSVCRVGQILLAAFANKLHYNVPTLKVIQTNTDGILIYFNKKFKDKVLELEKEWSETSGMMVDNDIVLKIWQKNVNNYLMLELEKGKIVEKSRGQWLKDNTHRIGSVKLTPPNGLICAKAAKQYLINDVDPMAHIIKCTDINDFIINCTKGPTYRGVVQRMADGSEVELYKCNRVIATKDTSVGKIYKYKMYKGEIRYAQMPAIPDYCKLVNDDLTTYNFSELKKELDYMYYIEKVIDILDVQWMQLKSDNIYKINKYNYNV